MPPPEVYRLIIHECLPLGVLIAAKVKEFFLPAEKMRKKNLNSFKSNFQMLSKSFLPLKSMPS